VERPEPAEIAREIATHVDNRFDTQLAKWLEVLNQEAQKDEPLHPGWANQEIARVSKKLRQDALDDLRHRLKSIDARRSPESRTEAIWIVRSLTTLLLGGEQLGEWQEAYDLAVDACERIVSDFDTVDWSGALVYVPQGMSRREVALSVLNDLLAFLDRVGGSDLPQIRAIRGRIEKLTAESENE